MRLRNSFLLKYGLPLANVNLFKYIEKICILISKARIRDIKAVFLESEDRTDSQNLLPGDMEGNKREEEKKNLHNNSQSCS